MRRYCEMRGEQEVSDLAAGSDFREPRYRREVFLRFYEFHLRYRAHPGCVYYLIPYLADRFGWDLEQKLWFAYVNGCTQNPVTSLAIVETFPDLRALDLRALESWFRENYVRLAFDTDRRYHKKFFVECAAKYKRLTCGHQAAFFDAAAGADARVTFRNLWVLCNQEYDYFGRLSVFSYLEYLRIVGIEVECDRLFLEDIHGSKSHRNGLCKVLGRDDLDWHDSNPGFDGRYPPELLRWLEREGAALLDEARTRFRGRDFERDVGYFTLESALCTYKSWHRPNRRYANVYNDMLVERIRVGKRALGRSLDVFWDARRARLPKHLRLEDNPADPGLCPKKQNHYRTTGQVIMMDREWPCFQNDFNDAVRKAQGEA